MTRYVSFCRDYGGQWTFKVLVQNSPRYTRRDYKELFGILWAHVVAGNPGVYADIYRCTKGKIPVRVLTVEVFTSPSLEFFPALISDVLIDGTLVRRIMLAE